MTIQFRRATAADRSALASLMHATDVHYWGEATPARDRFDAHVGDHALAPGGSCEIILAALNGRAVGYATFAVLYPAPDFGGAMFMKELFVLPEARSAGVGEGLMRYLAGHALERGCVRFDWSTETGYTGALRFYDRIGGARQTNKVYYRLDGDALRSLAAREEEVTPVPTDATTAP